MQLPSSSALTAAMKAMMIAFLSIASFRADCMEVLSASEQVPMVKVGVLQSIVICTEAGFYKFTFNILFSLRLKLNTKIGLNHPPTTTTTTNFL